jgi:hypothetical protein
MQVKHALKTILILSILVLFYFVFPPKPVAAQECGGDCSVVQCNGYYNEGGAWVYDWCSACGGNGCQSVGCPSGMYMTNNGCKQIGSGGGGSTGGGGGSCQNASVNCAPGATISLGQVVSQRCYSEWGGSFCGAIGTAQRQGDIEQTCCSGYHEATNETPYNSCDNPLIYTYACCPAGSTESCHMVEGPEVTRELGYSGDPSIQGCYGQGEYNKSWYHNGNCRDIIIRRGQEDEEQIYVCDWNVVCGTQIQSCTCISSCTQTAPTGLSIVAGPTVGTTARASWTLGTGGEAQFIWVDEDQAEVNAGCPTAGDCEMSLQLPAVANNMLVNGLTPLRTYYFRIINIGGPGCGDTEVTGTYTTPASTGVISGKVYLDSSNSCETTAFAGQNVVLDGVTTAVTGADGATAIRSM